METRRSEIEYYNIVDPESEINVLYSGDQVCKPLHESGGVRDHFLMHYVLSGKGTVRVAGRTHAVTRGGAFVFFPRERHWYQADSVHPWSYAWVGFSGTRAGVLLGRAGITSISPIFHSTYSADIAKHLADMRLSLSRRAAGFELKTEGLMYLIFSALMPPQSVSKRSRDDSSVALAMKFIDTNFQRDISAAQTAEYVGLERSYFSSLFSRTVSMSVKEYIMSRRIEKAKQFLVSMDLTVAEIAASVGYQDYFTFAKAFKKRTGVTPSEYKERMTARHQERLNYS
ncbi:MAG: AraC family transcriptional regulator [Spirochaetota bacterium]